MGRVRQEDEGEDGEDGRCWGGWGEDGESIGRMGEDGRGWGSTMGMMVRGWGRMMVEYEGRMGDDWGEDEGGWGGEFSWNPARQEAAPSVASRPHTVWHDCLAGFGFFIHSIFAEQQLLVRIGVLLVVVRKKMKKSDDNNKKVRRADAC